MKVGLADMFSVLELQMIETGLYTRRMQMLDFSRNSEMFDDQQREAWQIKSEQFGELASKVQEIKAQLMHEEEAELERQRIREIDED